MVLGCPKVRFGVAGINMQLDAMFGGKQEFVGGPASVIGLRA
jgi:hypothetical protein